MKWAGGNQLFCRAPSPRPSAAQQMTPINNRGRGRKRPASKPEITPVPSFQANSGGSNKINLEEYEEVEDEYGFRYMRKKQKVHSGPMAVVGSGEVTSTPKPFITIPAMKPATVYVSATPSTPTPSKQVLENNRRKRRSSFAVMAAQNQAARASSIGVSLTHQLPPDNVKTAEYHKHLLPDMPGPVKMRQMMIWACQKAAQQSTASSPLNQLGELKDELIQALFRNEINTSWYQRGTSLSSSNSDLITFYLPNPQNQELSECIDLYKNYQLKLKEECSTWQALKSEGYQAGSQESENQAPSRIDNSLNALFAEEFSQLSKWLQGLPLSIDRLDWNTKLALSFQDHSKQFCEGVFHQIFAKFFAGDLKSKQQRVEPMMVLRAMSHPAHPSNE